MHGRFDVRCFEDAFDLNGEDTVTVDPARSTHCEPAPGNAWNASRQSGSRRSPQFVPATSSSSSSSVRT